MSLISKPFDIQKTINNGIVAFIEGLCSGCPLCLPHGVEGVHSYQPHGTMLGRSSSSTYMHLEGGPPLLSPTVALTDEARLEEHQSTDNSPHNIWEAPSELRTPCSHQ